MGLLLLLELVLAVLLVMVHVSVRGCYASTSTSSSSSSSSSMQQETSDVADQIMRRRLAEFLSKSSTGLPGDAGGGSHAGDVVAAVGAADDESPGGDVR